jgi:hypothetical protein
MTLPSIGPIQFDEDDPNDRRRSQYVFKAQLDEIEKVSVHREPILISF